MQQQIVIKLCGKLDQIFHDISTNMSNKLDLLVQNHDLFAGNYQENFNAANQPSGFSHRLHELGHPEKGQITQGPNFCMYTVSIIITRY